MRRLVWLVVVIALLWSGWWVFADRTLRAGLDHWLEARRAEGWQAEVAGIESRGFPLQLENTLVRPMLADPDTGVAFSTDALRIAAPVWWPGHITLTFPDEEIYLASTGDNLTVAASDAWADMRLHPGTALEVQTMSLTSGPWDVRSSEGGLMSASGLTLEMMQAENMPERYAFTVDAPAFQPGSLPRAAWRIPADWPVAFDSLVLEATVDFERPIDRATIEDARPQPRRVDLRRVEAQWGDLLLQGAAELDVSEQGELTGDVMLQARNWREMLNLAETAGAIPEALRPQLEKVLAALARGSGNPEALDLALSLQDGTVYLGFIPLGSAPRLVLR